MYPVDTPYTTCKFCGTPFTEGVCKVCGKYSNEMVPRTSLCKDCFNKRRRLYGQYRVRTTDQNIAHYRRLCKEADERFAAWTKQLKSIKTHALTEEEWLAACKYFGGCALCDSESIDARGYFIDFKDGGRYNACNVIPLCEKCATELKYQHNPFKRLNQYTNSSLKVVRGLSVDKLNRVADYLQGIIGGISNE